ncbi:MAG: hypothetical protein ACT4QC_19950 [Planctomycetaceae bacterium]
MHFVGKILVVLQLVLSLVFLAFAGVVYTAHVKWRDEAQKQKEMVASLQKKLGDKTSEAETIDRTLRGKENAATERANIAEAAQRDLVKEVARLKAENGELQVERKTATQQSSVALSESSARWDEANNVRELNRDLTVKRDKELGERIRMEDELRSKEQELVQAETKNRQLIARIGQYQQALQQAGINDDISQLATKGTPPPPVDGEILEIKPAREKGSSELVEVSLGSDDGLKKGHEMTVWRPGVNSAQKARYLARIEIVRVDPQRAVGRVLEESRNGRIQRGDNVTTKL